MSGIDEQRNIPECYRCGEIPEFWILMGEDGWTVGTIYNEKVIRTRGDKTSLGLFYRTFGGVERALKTEIKEVRCSRCGTTTRCPSPTFTNIFRERMRKRLLEEE